MPQRHYNRSGKRVNHVANHILKGVGKGNANHTLSDDDGEGDSVANHITKGKGKGASSHQDAWEEGWTKPAKFRLTWTFGAKEGGMDCYTSGQYSGRGTWYQCHRDPGANWQEDIWRPGVVWEDKGWAFYPANHLVVLTAEEHWYLWPGLAQHGMADEWGNMHDLWVEGVHAVPRSAKPRRFRKRRGSH